MHSNVGETSRRAAASGDNRTPQPTRANTNRVLRQEKCLVQRLLPLEKRLRFVQRKRKRDLPGLLSALGRHSVFCRYRNEPPVAGRILPHLIAHAFRCALQERDTQFWVPHNTTLRRVLRTHVSAIPSRYQSKPASARDHLKMTVAALPSAHNLVRITIIEP